ncbi:MAG: outer membrane lipoprotein-sorting protein, partial [Chitinophagia bacterium]|nr:outer membrane lipoprotein-sorting protein [Chitinophagia bacterium]
QIVTDKAGWAFNPFMGQTKAEAMTADDVKEAQVQLDLQGPLVDYKTKGNKIAYLGKDEVDGTECYKLKVTFPTGKMETIYIDATTYFHIKSVEKVVADGKEIETTQMLSNYKQLPEGIFVPMSMDMGMGVMEVKTVVINKDVDENTFVPKS